MSNQDKAVKPSTDGVATASNQTPAAIDGNTSKLERLLELLLSRETTNLEKEAADKQRYAALSAQREKNQSQNARNLLRLQARCKHIKGLGKRTVKHEAQHEQVPEPDHQPYTAQHDGGGAHGAQQRYRYGETTQGHEQV